MTGSLYVIYICMSYTHTSIATLQHDISSADSRTDELSTARGKEGEASGWVWRQLLRDIEDETNTAGPHKPRLWSRGSVMGGEARENKPGEKNADENDRAYG